MSFGNYAPFYRPNYYPMQNMQPMQAIQQMQDAPGQVPQIPQQYQVPQAPQMQQMPLQTQSANDMIVVLNENEATSYFVLPNNTVTLWDKNLPTIYLKSVDSNGVPSMRILDYTERIPIAQKPTQEHVCQCSGKFVKVEDFEVLQAKIEELTAKVEEYKPKARNKKTEVEDDE